MGGENVQAATQTYLQMYEASYYIKLVKVQNKELEKRNKGNSKVSDRAGNL